MDPHIRKEVSLDSKGGVHNSRANSCVNSRVGSRENLCEECIQNPLDLIDASIQVDLSDSERGWGSDEEGGGGKGGPDEGTISRRRAGELGVNKKGTPLYSREDIREQYCINDKELQVLDRQGSKRLFGCFSNQGQSGISPCSGGAKGRKFILGSCIARASSEDELHNQIQITAKRPISPGLRSTTWNGHHRYYDPRQDEEEGFDEQYFRRRPKSFCVPPGGPSGPRVHYLPQGNPGSQSGGAPPHGIYIDMEHRMMAFNSYPLLRTTPYPTIGIPGSSSNLNPNYVGGYTLPPTAAFFPMGSYSRCQTTLLETQHEPSGLTQPNTPDLLMHRRQGGTHEVSMDDRKQKHVSFDSSSLMRSQTLASMDEATFHRTQPAQPIPVAEPLLPAITNHTTPSKSYENLIEAKMTTDFEYFQHILPPQLARQIMLDRLKRNSMRTQATQTDTSKNRNSPQILTSPKNAQKVFMVSEGVQTNGFNNCDGPDKSVLPPTRFSVQAVPVAATSTSPIRTILPMEYKSSTHLQGNTATSSNMSAYQLQVYHLESQDVRVSQGWNPMFGNSSYIISPIYATAPRSRRERSHVSDDYHFHQKFLSHQNNTKMSTRSMSQSDMLAPEQLNDALLEMQKNEQLHFAQQPMIGHHRHQKIHESSQLRKNHGSMFVQHGHHHRHHHHHHHRHILHLHKSHSDGELLDEDEMNGDRVLKSSKAVKFVTNKDHTSQNTRTPFCGNGTIGHGEKDSSTNTIVHNQDNHSNDSKILETGWAETFYAPGSIRTLYHSKGTDTDENITKSREENLVTLPDDVTFKQPLFIGDDPSEDAGENVTSYLERSFLITSADVEEKLRESRKSSSSGSYTVTSGLGLKTICSPLENLTSHIGKDEELVPSQPDHLQIETESQLRMDENLESQENTIVGIFQTETLANPDDVTGWSDSEPSYTPVMLRKQELTLNLHKETSSLPLNLPQEFTPPDESTNDNTLIWQALTSESEDTQIKSAAFESQSRCQSEDSNPKVMNGKVHAPSSGVVEKIERDVNSVLGTNGLATSPGMHSGFQSADWVVDRTPINTPVNERISVGMIKLSDEETSDHVSSEELCKSSDITTPPGSMTSSLEPLSIDVIKVDQEKIYSSKIDKNETSFDTSKLPCQHPQTFVTQSEEIQPPADKDGVVTEGLVKVVPLMAPPAGFADSPDHVTSKKLPVYHEAIPDQILPHEELLTAENFILQAMPTLQIAETFQAPELLNSATFCDDPIIDYKVVEVDVIQTTRTRTFESIPKRKSSPASVASRVSGASRHRSRSRSRSKERLLSKLARSGEIIITSEEDDDIKGLYVGAYDKRSWAFIGNLTDSSRSGPACTKWKACPLIRSESVESTQSEREFKKKYQAITHRMVHRKSSAVMYNRILERTFECNKTVRVRRVKGEFGFRIHGSRPVVVSAIEPDTPAETSGLEVGDIILTINDVNVLDLSHTEVVKFAQTGNDELELGLAHVPESGCPENPADVAMGRLDESLTLLQSGYLWKLSRSAIPGGESKWSKRFFVLRADSCLYFFKQESESRPLGAFLASGCTILEGSEAEDQQSGLGRNFVFRLVFPSYNRPTCHHKSYDTSSASCRLLCLAAESQAELTSWLNIVDSCAQSQEHSDDPWRDLAEQRQYQPSNHFPKQDCEGYLLKLDAKTQTWKRRYCVLADACLFVYSNAESCPAIASLCLQGYRVLSTGSVGSKRYLFELIPPEQGMRFFYFLAETETEKKRWLASLEYSMDQWLKLS